MQNSRFLLSYSITFDQGKIAFALFVSPSKAFTNVASIKRS